MPNVVDNGRKTFDLLGKKRHDHYWRLALSRVPGVGPVMNARLIRRFGSPEAVFRASMEELVGVERLGRRVAQAILSFREFDPVEEELKRIEQLGIDLVPYGEACYPVNLASIPDPPPYLYAKGTLRLEDHLAVAVVGSRSASHYGLQTAYRLAKDLARKGVTVVSGLARGIDSEAHKGALAGGGRTIAVLGSGLNVIYPPENKGLYEQIARQGAVVSEFPLDKKPEAVNFPIRNRIISGLTLGVAVVEAGQKSGSLITARLAGEQGREVFAVPGSVDSIRSRGSHQLIRQGAHLVETADDILEILGGLLHSWKGTQKAERVEKEVPEKRALTADEQALVGLLGIEPVHADDIIRLGGFSPATAMSLLLKLELDGIVKQLPGKLFILAD